MNVVSPLGELSRSELNRLSNPTSITAALVKAAVIYLCTLVIAPYHNEIMINRRAACEAAARGKKHNKIFLKM